MIGNSFYICEDNFIGHKNRKSESLYPITFNAPTYNIEQKNLNYMNYYTNAFKIKIEKFLKKKKKIKKQMFNARICMDKYIIEYLNFNKVIEQIVLLKKQNNEKKRKRKKKNKKKEKKEEKTVWYFKIIILIIMYIFQTI